MSLCISPQCSQPNNTDTILFCEACGSELLLQGRYRAMRKLGAGGFGITYEVLRVHSNIPEVLKVLTETRPKAVELFQQEARVLSELRHPGIPHVEPNNYFVYFPRGSTDPVHCLVMEKIVGMDLEQYMEKRQQRPIEQQQAIDWLKELVGILGQVHQQNFFHRDIKPSNIMIRSSGELTLIDFGTVRQVTGTIVNQQGGVTGIVSPGYTPQEQSNNSAVPQSDFFALGRTFVNLLTGKHPLDSYDSYNDEIKWRNSAPSISPPLADLIDEMMAHTPKQRPANTQVILQRLVTIEQQLYPATPVKIPPAPKVVPPNTLNLNVNNPQPVNDPHLNPIVRSPFTAAEKRLFSAWIVFNTFGLGLFFFPVYQSLISPEVAVIVTMVAFVWGTFQYIVLSQTKLKIGAWQWILVTGLGVLTAAILTSISPWFILTSGGLVGTGQWLLLRPHFFKSGWWISVNFIGALILIYVVLTSRSELLINICMLISYSIATGNVLLWLVRNQQKIKNNQVP